MPDEELSQLHDERSAGFEETAAILWTPLLDPLPAPQRAAVLMRVLEGESFQTIAAVLGTKRQHARVLYWRAIAALRAEQIEE